MRNTPGKQPGDHAGHLAGDRFGGSGGLDNLVSQYWLVNLSSYKLLENEWYRAIRDGKTVGVSVCVEYAGDDLRPSAFSIEYTIDGEEHSKHITFYSSDSHVEAQFQANIALTSTIHKALTSGRIICFYQPIVSIQSGRIEKYETLVRMIDESANIIPPLDFLQTAKKTRLYPQITRTVIEHACHTFKERNE